MDSNYAARFINYFNIHYADRMELSEFTDIRLLGESIRSWHPDICLVGSEMLQEIGDAVKSGSNVVILTEDMEEETNGLLAIYKYQKAELLYKEILNVFADKKNGFHAFRKRAEGSAACYAFLSASGGAGATTVALAYAARLAAEKRVLYLSLQQYSNADLVLKAEGNGKFDDVLFALKSRRGTLSLKLESLVRTSRENIHFFVSCENPMDLQEMTADEVKRLLREVVTGGQYDEIIIDLDSRLGEIELAALEECDYIVVVEGGNASNSMKFNKFYTALETVEQKRQRELLSRLCLFYNRFSNKTSGDIAGKQIRVVGGIPRFEGIQMEAIVSRMSKMDCFGQLRSLEMNGQ